MFDYSATATDYSAMGVRLLIRGDRLLGHGDQLLGHEGQANTRRLLHEINSVWVHTKNRAAQTLTTAPLGGTLQVASELFGLRYLSLGGTRTASAKALVTRWHPDSARRDTRLSTSSHEIHQLFTLVHLPDLKQDNLTFVLKFNPSNF